MDYTCHVKVSVVGVNVFNLFTGGVSAGYPKPETNTASP